MDCRDDNDKTVPDSIGLDKYLVKVNPVEAMLDDNYFLRKLLATQGDPMDVGSSLMGVQKQLADVEEARQGFRRAPYGHEVRGNDMT